MKRILCYGDSNTCGNIPADGRRYPADVRWTGVAAKLLGDGYSIIEEGLNGRTTSFDDYYVDCRNGRKGLGYALCAHAPIDLIVVSLGTNDLKYTGAVGSYKGLDELLRSEHADAAIRRQAAAFFPNGVKIPCHLPHPSLSGYCCPASGIEHLQQVRRIFEICRKYFARIAAAHGAEFLDAAAYAEPFCEGLRPYGTGIASGTRNGNSEEDPDNL